MFLQPLARARALLLPSALALLASCGTSSAEVLHQGAAAGSGGGASSATTGSGPAGSTASAGSSGGGTTTACKRGLAYGLDSVADLTALSTGIRWWYDWATAPNAPVATAHAALGVEFVPMAWGQGSLPDLATQVPADASYLLGFNEPNFGSQANLTPAQAAALWPQVEAFAKQRNLAIASPAVNYCGSPCNVTNPFDWLEQFFAACPGCQVDYIAVHWYACSGSALSPRTCSSSRQVPAAALAHGVRLHRLERQRALRATARGVHEEACSPCSRPTPGCSAMHGSPAAAPGLPWDLLGADGTLTPLGQIYVGYPETCKP